MQIPHCITHFEWTYVSHSSALVQQNYKPIEEGFSNGACADVVHDMITATLLTATEFPPGGGGQ